MSWFLRGLRSGIKTERYPTKAQGATPGYPADTTLSDSVQAQELENLCPSGAIDAQAGVALADRDRCVQCMRCYPRDGAPAMEWQRDYTVAHVTKIESELPPAFHRSVHVRVVDAGDCGSCLNEIGHLNDPLYNAHSFGIFVTPTPRHADVLLVVGPVTAQMREELRTAYEAMPEPKRVVAVGACAINGGIFGPSLMCGSGAADAVPVNIVVPGCPPPPVAILRALLMACGQA